MDCTLQGAPTDRKPSTPPALPIKQRRSQSSMSSIPDLQLQGVQNLSGSSPPASPFIDVFAVSTDCNAPQCPIHHRYGPPGYHQERFFSEQTPPPVPKKRLVRTLSLPVVTQYSTARQDTHPIRFESPLQTVEDSPTKHAAEGKRDSLQAQCLRQVNFDTPDENLQELFSLCQQEQVYVAIQDYYLQFLKYATKNIEASVLLKEQEVEMLRALQPQDILLCEKYHPEETEQDSYFLVDFPMALGGLLSAKVNRRGSAPTGPVPIPCHPNIEEIVAHFLPRGVPQKQQFSTYQPATEASELSHEGSTELHQACDVITKGHTALSFLERGFTVTIVRDFPWATLEDFVQEGISLHRSQPDLYERRLCLLMLQLVLGLQHLEIHNVKHTELKESKIMLVWSCIKNRESVKKPEDARRFMKEGIDTIGKGKSSKKVHALWERWGMPRVVISHSDVQVDPTKDVLHDRLQLGSLLKYCMHQHMNTHQNTQYTRVLLLLTNQLTCEKREFQTADIVGVLQALLWGPRAGLFEKNQPNTAVIHNWLMVKHSLLVLKFAGKGLFLDQCDSNWEDYLCLQYLSLTDPDTILRITAQMGLH